MEKLSRKYIIYILVQDRMGLSIQRLSNLQSQIQVSRGELLEALPEAEQPDDSSKIALVGIDRKFLRLECGMECIIRLTEEDANLLLAISSFDERYQTFTDKIRLEFGRKIGPGRKVYVTVEGISYQVPGVVRYRGEFHAPFLNDTRTMFGVELTVSMVHKLVKLKILSRHHCPRDPMR